MKRLPYNLSKNDMHHFRALHAKDIARLVEIEQSAQAFPWTAKMLEETIAAGYVAQGLVINHELCAYYIVSVVAPEAEILTICVHKSFQRMGWAKAFLKYLFQNCLENHIETIFLEVRASNLAAISLYQQLGFKQVGLRKDYYPAGDQQREDALLFRLQLH